jgi:hypothetical protein
LLLGYRLSLPAIIRDTDPNAHRLVMVVVVIDLMVRRRGVDYIWEGDVVRHLMSSPTGNVTVLSAS